MEDAHVAQVDLGNGNSLFAVFDGHGGKLILIKVPKLLSLLENELSLSWPKIKIISLKTMRKL